MTARYVADEAALREAVGKHTPVWEYNDLGFRLDCGCNEFTHGGVDRGEAERRFAEHLTGALSNVVQPREDAVREANAAYWATASVRLTDYEDEFLLLIVDDQPVPEGKKFAPDSHVLIACRGEIVRDFLYPGYRIWTLAAHWKDDLDGLRAALTPTTPGTDRPAAEDGPRNTGTGSAT